MIYTAAMPAKNAPVLIKSLDINLFIINHSFATSVCSVGSAGTSAAV